MLALDIPVNIWHHQLFLPCPTLFGGDAKRIVQHWNKQNRDQAPHAFVSGLSSSQIADNFFTIYTNAAEQDIWEPEAFFVQGWNS